MKTSAELQRQGFYRKLIYFGMILALFTLATFSGTFLRAASGGRISGWTVGERAENLQLRETSHGQASVLGSTARVAMTGSRGFAVCLLWMTAIEKQKRHEWNELELLTNVITKLQPHFLTPWLFQSWNLSYNVSVESDRVRDKYFHIGKGIQLLAEGERVNRIRCTDPRPPGRLEAYEVGHPDMRYWVAFYYMNKFGTSDEQHTLRSLLQISCINPMKRRPQDLRPDGRTVDPVKFEEFVKENPYLCRRLRMFLRCSRPDDVVDFLQDNARIQSRYVEEDAGVWRLNRNTDDQFPVFPKWGAAGEFAEAPTHGDVGGEFDNYHAAWAWNTFAQDPTPPFIEYEPEDEPPPYDHLRFRKPRSPALIIFRQQPARCKTAIADRLQKEGWFDESGWVVDEGYNTNLWFPKSRVVAGNNPKYSSLQRWQEAYQAWEYNGRVHGLTMEQTEIDRREELAAEYRQAYAVAKGTRGEDVRRELVSPSMWDSFQAHRSLNILFINKYMTNFDHFLYGAQAESDPRTVKARRLLFEADRLRRSGNPEGAIARFREAFQEFCGGAGRRGLLEDFPRFRNDSNQQEELYEKHLSYLRLLEDNYGPRVHGAMTVCSLVGAAGQNIPRNLPSLAPFAPAMLYFENPKIRELPSPFAGPVDGVDSAEKPWVNEQISTQMKIRVGIIRQPTPAPESAPTSPPGMPADAPPKPSRGPK